MRTYRITSGTFRVSETKVLGVGDTVELDDATAAAHVSRLQPVVKPPAPAAAPIPAPAPTPAAPVPPAAPVK